MSKTDGIMYLRQPSFGGYYALPGPSVYFNNRIPAVPLDAPVTTTLGCVGTNLVAELVIGTNAWGPTTRVLASGYLDPQPDLVREIYGVGPGVSARVRVWDSRAGSFEDAQATSAMRGAGPQFSIQLQGGEYPPVNITQFFR